MAVIFDNVSRELIHSIELASNNIEVPIILKYFVFIEGEDDSQITPIVLSLTNITADMFSIQATATRADLYNRRFPYGETTIFDNKYVGLTI